jgi:hypothetical protein
VPFDFEGRHATDVHVNLRHATALALLAWYLLVPPLMESTEKPEPDVDAPFGKWQRIDSFNSEDECDKGLDAHLQAMREGSFTNPSGVPVNLFQLQLGTCFADDDPRLKEK